MAKVITSVDDTILIKNSKFSKTKITKK